MDLITQHEVDSRFAELVLDVEELEGLVAAGWWSDFSSGFAIGFGTVAAGAGVVGIGVGIGAALT